MCVKKIDQCVIHILGSASAQVTDHRMQSAVLIEADGKHILFDSGIPLMQCMYKYNCVCNVEHIFISHMHTDHISLLPLNIKQLQLAKFADTINIFGPPGIEDVMATALPIFYVINTPEYPEYRLFPLEKKHIVSEHVMVTAYTNSHLQKPKYIQRNKQNPDMLINSYSFCIHYKNKKIVYTGDINDLDDISNMCEHADLVICDGAHIPAQRESIEEFCEYHSIKKWAITHYSTQMFSDTDKIFYVNDGDKLII